EDGIRDDLVTGVQTCALPICALMDAISAQSRQAGCTRLWLTTTDNNRRARTFYERWGMNIARVHRGGVAASRAVKPSIPEVDAEIGRASCRERSGDVSGGEIT